MDDIGNIIYILFVLISLLAGVWQNFNKQKDEKKGSPQPASQSQPQYSSPHDRDELREARELKSEKDLAAAERLREMQRAAEEAASQRRLKKRDLLEETKNSITAEPPIDKEEFDARKAVIYSEILNPPYL